MILIFDKKLREELLKEANNVVQINNFVKLCFEEGRGDNFYKYYVAFVSQLIEIRASQGKSAKYMSREIGISEEEYIEFEGLERVATKIIAKAMDILGVNMIDLIAEKDPKDDLIKELNLHKEEIGILKLQNKTLQNTQETLIRRIEELEKK